MDHHAPELHDHDLSGALLRPVTFIKTHDVRRVYGCWAKGGACRIRVFEALTRPEPPPVVVCSQVAGEDVECISAVVEYIAPAIVARYLPHRFDELEPVVWLEHYPLHRDRRLRGHDRLDLARVTFGHWRPTVIRSGSDSRIKIGEPCWTALDATALANLLGHPSVLDD
jgi:hypothetical protein